MNSILKFVFVFLNDGLPWVLIVAPVYIFFRIFYIYITSKGKLFIKYNIVHESILFMFVIFTTMLFVQTWAVDTNGKSDINIIPFYMVYTQISEMNNSQSSYSLFLLNIIGNIAVFVPIGIFSAYLFKGSISRTIGLGFYISFIIEVGQIPLNRTSDVDDLILNTTGAAFGFAVYKTGNFVKRKLKLSDV